MLHLDPGDVPHLDRQLPDLGDMRHLSLIQVLRKLDQLHQLLPVVPGVEALGLRLRQHRLLPSKVPLLLVKLELLLPSILSRERVCLVWLLCARILSMYS
jgi:hypothetical protein